MDVAMIPKSEPLLSVPVFPDGVESTAIESLNILLGAFGSDGSSARASALVGLQRHIASLVDCVFPVTGDSAEFAGSDSLDGNDYIHPVKVAALAALIGSQLGLGRTAIINLATATVLMNLGYLTLHQSVIGEPRLLLESEWEEHVHTHPARSIGLLTQSGLPDDCLRTIIQHHERWDGSGYPSRLRGAEICLDARNPGGGRLVRVAAVGTGPPRGRRHQRRTRGDRGRERQTVRSGCCRRVRAGHCAVRRHHAPGTRRRRLSTREAAR